MTSFTITPLTDHTAAEVVGVDFSHPVDAAIRSALNGAFADHHVLVMRDQHFTPEQFVAAARIFGELLPHDKKERHVPGHPQVEYISNEEVVNGKRIIPGETFHTDHSNHPRPPKATTLFAVEDGHLDIMGTRDGKPAVVATVGPGDVLGEVAFIDDSPRSVSVRAGEENVTVRAWDKKKLSDALSSDPELLAKFSVAMCELLVERLRDTARRV